MISLVSFNIVRHLRLPRGTALRLGGKSPNRELRQMKSQLGQRVAGTARRIPSTSSKHASRGLHCVGPRGEREPRRGIFLRRRLSSLSTPFGRAGRPRKAFSRIIMLLRHHRLCGACIRDRATVLTITKKRKNASGKMTPTQKSLYGARRCQTRRHLIIESRGFSAFQ